MKRRILKLFAANGKKKESYEEEVNILIRQKYSLPEELSILRRRDDKPEAFNEYNLYCEECKIKARAIVFGEI